MQSLGVIAGAGARRCLALLAAAQIDAHGNINSSRSTAGRFIVGSGGANDLAAGGAACLVVMPLKAGKFVDKLPFMTTRIRRLAAVATDLGLLERGEDGRLWATGVMCQAGAEHDTLAEIRRHCGAALAAAPHLARFDPPTTRELASLRRFDPQRAILA